MLSKWRAGVQSQKDWAVSLYTTPSPDPDVKLVPVNVEKTGCGPVWDCIMGTQGRIQDFPYRGCTPPTQLLFSENVCENESIGSRRGAVHWKILYVDPPIKYMFHVPNHLKVMAYTKVG